MLMNKRTLRDIRLKAIGYKGYNLSIFLFATKDIRKSTRVLGRVMHQNFHSDIAEKCAHLKPQTTRYFHNTETMGAVHHAVPIPTR